MIVGLVVLEGRNRIELLTDDEERAWRRGIARAVLIMVTRERRGPITWLWRLELPGCPDLFTDSRAIAMAWITDVAMAAVASAAIANAAELGLDLGDDAPAGAFGPVPLPLPRN